VGNYVRHAALHFSTNMGSSETKSDSNSAANKEQEKKRRLECTYCGRLFQNTTELMEHEFMHTTGK